MNLVVCVTKHLNLFDPTEYHIDLPFGLTGVTGSLMTFFVCFYNGHVFGRYNKLYDLTQLMGETLLELVSYLKLQVDQRGAREKIAKLAIASCFTFFFERTETDEGKISTN